MYQDSGVFAPSTTAYQSPCGRISVEREGPDQFIVYGPPVEPIGIYPDLSDAMLVAKALEKLAEPVKRKRSS